MKVRRTMGVSECGKMCIIADCIALPAQIKVHKPERLLEAVG
jgi:hypothetical protein